MNQFREIKIAMSSNQCTAGTVMPKSDRKFTWHGYGCLFDPIRAWAMSIFRNKSAYAELDEDSEPLVDNMSTFKPTYMGSTLIRLATSRPTKRYSRLP
ncbi:hypothetical protein BKA59DRAFT_467228 [Fusarium tricinctum]|uniref:Uncharacterized protein n=1 Tax=Fusarium tricinctum TaxID=61284 RepID=A0A8K0S4T1_9HYPO|nr:hypothetical protein BKA59DRAFT_467228 [Fusarium tricinctum]